MCCAATATTSGAISPRSRARCISRTRSVSDPAALVERAAEFIAAGVDVIVWSMQGAIDVARIGPLAEAI